MRIKKDIELVWNGDSPREMEGSFRCDDWCFGGTKEEVLEQIGSLLGQLEIDCEEA